MKNMCTFKSFSLIRSQTIETNQTFLFIWSVCCFRIFLDLLVLSKTFECLPKCNRNRFLIFFEFIVLKEDQWLSSSFDSNDFLYLLPIKSGFINFPRSKLVLWKIRIWWNDFGKRSSIFSFSISSLFYYRTQEIYKKFKIDSLTLMIVSPSHSFFSIVERFVDAKSTSWICYSINILSNQPTIRRRIRVLKRTNYSSGWANILIKRITYSFGGCHRKDTLEKKDEFDNRKKK